RTVTVSDCLDFSGCMFVTETDDPVNVAFPVAGWSTPTIVNPVTKRANELIVELPSFSIVAVTVNGGGVGAGGDATMFILRLYILWSLPATPGNANAAIASPSSKHNTLRVRFIWKSPKTRPCEMPAPSRPCERPSLDRRPSRPDERA